MENKPLIVQSDRTLLLEVNSPNYDACRDDIIAFSELVKSPDFIHTYSLSNLSLWNAISAGLSPETILNRLEKWSKFPIQEIIKAYITDISSRYGKLILTQDKDSYYLKVKDEMIFLQILNNSKLMKYFLSVDKTKWIFEVKKNERGNLKLGLIKLDYPIEDKIPLKALSVFPIKLRPSLKLRPYQIEACNALLGNLEPGTGYGTLVLPCGAGKTVVGISIMSSLNTDTLIVCPNILAVRQWKTELVEKTLVKASDIGEYSGEHKEIKPITIATYQILTKRKKKKKEDEIENKKDNKKIIEKPKEDEFNHLDFFEKRNWGLIIFDEVQVLPAPVFRYTCNLQSIYRVGMTATLIREDRLEKDVFSLIGPKRYDVPWSELESKGFIAQAVCTEIRLKMNHKENLEYALAEKLSSKNRIAACNPEKLKIVSQLLEKHKDEYILIIGMYLDQLNRLGRKLKLPVITGSMNNSSREKWFNKFRTGEIKILIVSKIANMAIDLPDASVAIQVSGTFGSRQEEAQRLGRILRPKDKTSYFYTIVSQYTKEEEYSANRQKFLIEQGYSYRIEER
ncbi:MAG: DEAD/DEAH box helicase [Sphaerochaetaceae bacterium]|nr:DEAD/DEAH box helicase [Sphaerochaetaceae bacterium]